VVRIWCQILVKFWLNVEVFLTSYPDCSKDVTIWPKYNLNIYRIRPFKHTVHLANWNRGTLIRKHFPELSENFKFWKSVRK